MTAALRVARLDAAEMHRSVPDLAILLVRCVAAGASVSFLSPLDPARAAAFWTARAGEVAAGTRLMLAAWLEAALVGAVSVDCAMPENQPHRAEVQKMLVDPGVRRRGIGRALVLAAEAAAREAGRTLLTLDTEAGGAGEQLYRSMQWLPAGSIPGYALNPDGTVCDTVLFWKRLG